MQVLQNLHNNKAFKLFLLLAGFFICNTLVAEFVGIKIFSLEKSIGIDPVNFSFFGVDGLGFNLTAGVVLWPVVFIMTDIINEYFGKKSVKVLSYLAVFLILYAFAMVFFAIDLPPNEWWKNESGQLSPNPDLHVTDMNLAFNTVMGQGLWIIIGSMIAFLVGQIVDVSIFHRIKKWTGGEKVWLRATGSTFVSQFIDSYIVLIVAFYIGADWDLSRVLAIGTMNLIYKVVIAVLLTPMIYLAHAIIDRYLGSELATSMKEEAARS